MTFLVPGCFFAFRDAPWVGSGFKAFSPEQGEVEITNSLAEATDCLPGSSCQTMKMKAFRVWERLLRGEDLGG